MSDTGSWEPLVIFREILLGVYSSAQNQTFWQAYVNYDLNDYKFKRTTHVLNAEFMYPPEVL